MAGKVLPSDGEEPENEVNGQEDDITLDHRIQDVLGKALRAYSQDIVSEPIPDKFLALLALLEAKEREAK
ncbi:NepR family anti-sigma factor [Labrys monachus]|uniref:Anti-sigma factor NepR domain-containing protein n=1 Tax=Labrys monachus TaxID=217067 RepID=A0ABU0FAV2_9HYPH|nr:NepR family anti-sigma factor [Labrys monachus]MDQ0391457.1 hypothetical protein [Labrys monachus]